jgi:hypothetical protein
MSSAYHDWLTENKEGDKNQKAKGKEGTVPRAVASAFGYVIICQ